MQPSPARGDVWRARLGSPSAAIGHEQAKERPVLVVSANFVNRSAANMVIVLPLTTTLRRVRSHVVIDPPEGGIDQPSAAQCEQIRSLSAQRLLSRLGRVSEATMKQVEYAIRMVLDLR